MTILESSHLRFGNMLNLSAKSIIFISLLSLNELIFMMTGLKRTISILLMIPASFMIVHYWSYFLQNKIVLMFITPVAVYFLFAVIYGMLSGNIDFSLIPAIFLSSALAISISIHIVKSDNETINDIVELSKNILLLSTVSIVLSPWYYPYMLELQPLQISGERFSGFLSNPNDASLVAIGFLNFVLYRPYNKKIVTILTIILATFATYHTLSKTGMVMYFASFLIFAFWKRKWTIFSILFIFVLSVPHIYIFLSGTSYTLPLDDSRSYRTEKIARFFSGDISDRNTGDRLTLWYDAIQRIKFDFPHGAGLGTFHRLVDSVYVHSLDDWYGVHNMYLMIFGEAGLVALAVFVACYGRLIGLALFSFKDGLPFAVLSIFLVFFCSIHDSFGIRSQMVILAIVVGLLGRNINRNPCDHRLR